MRVLAVRQPWAAMIMSGEKIDEIRTQKTNIKERIAIYASRTKPKPEDWDWLEEYGISDCHFENENVDPFPPGMILGTVLLHDCKKITKQEFEQTVHQHCNNPITYNKRMYAWKLDDPWPMKPIPFKFQKGQVVWSTIADKLIWGV